MEDINFTSSRGYFIPKFNLRFVLYNLLMLLDGGSHFIKVWGVFYKCLGQFVILFN
jgi:hypothetical protein